MIQSKIRLQTTNFIDKIFAREEHFQFLDCRKCQNSTKTNPFTSIKRWTTL